MRFGRAASRSRQTSQPPESGAVARRSAAVDRRSALAAEIALVAIAAVWGATFVLVQDAVRRMPVLAFLGWRFSAAALVVLPFVLRDARELPAAGWRGGLAMGLALTAGYAFQTFGLTRTTASNAGFITGLYVVLTPLLGALLFGRRATLRTWAAAGAATLGLLLLSGGAARVNAVGDGLVLLCAAAFAMHILLTARAVGRHPTGPLVLAQLAVCGLACLAAAAALGHLRPPPDLAVWGTLALTAIVASALGFFVQTHAQRRTTPARTALVLASEPVFAGLFAYLWRGETLTALQWAGAGIILAAIVWVELAPRGRVPGAGGGAR